MSVVRHGAARVLGSLPLAVLAAALVTLGPAIRAASAQELVPVDDRVETFVVGPRYDRRARRRIGEARLTNRSRFSVRTPIRVVLEGIAPEVLLNRDGETEAGEPFVDVELGDGVLAPGERVLGVQLVFARRSEFQVRTEGIRFKVNALSAAPFALSTHRSVDVLFSVRIDAPGGEIALSLERLDALGVGPNQPLAMVDDGTQGDVVAGDGIYSATVALDGAAFEPGDLLQFRAAGQVDGFPVATETLDLGVTGFSTRAAPTQLEGNLLSKLLPGDDEALEVVADEVLIQAAPGTADAVIASALETALAAAVPGVTGEVVGSLLPLSTYQARLSRVLNVTEFLDLLAALRAQPGVEDAFANAVLEATAIPNDPGLVPGDVNEQFAVGLINVPAVWEHTRGRRADGTPVRVRVLDTGFETGHSDLGVVTGDADAAGPGSLKPGHGTRMTGIIGATGDNGNGIAGIAHEAEVSVSQILNSQGVVVADAGRTTGWTLGQRLMDLPATAAGGPEVVNISYGGRWVTSIAGRDIYKVGYLCRGVRVATDAGMMVVVSAGNNTDTGSTNFSYPGRCNINNNLPKSGDRVVEKQRLLAVSNTRLDDTLHNTSLSGSYVDFAAPGTDVVSTTIGDGYNRGTGSSEAAAVTSGVVALLLASGADKDLIEGALKDTGAATDQGYVRIDALAALAQLNQPPNITSETFTIDENLTDVGVVLASDAEGFPVTLAILPGGDGDQFTLDANTGTLAFGVAPDFEIPTDGNADNVYQFTVQALDGPAVSPATKSFEQLITVVVNDVIENTPPSVGVGQVFSVAENSPDATPVGAVVATDAESAPDALTFEIVDGVPSNPFAISASGALTVADGTALDHEVDPTFTLTVRVFDGELSGSGTVVVNVTDVDEAPVVSPATFTVVENSPIGTPVGTVAVTDPEGATSFGFNIVAGNTGGAFAIDDNGAITVANPGALDFEGASPSFSLDVSANDGAETGQGVITVDVLNANDAPVVVIPIPDQGVLEGQPFDLPIAANFDDPDALDVLTFTASGLPAGISMNQGNLTGTPTETGTFVVTVIATDDQNPALSTSSQFTLVVNPDRATIFVAQFDGPGISRVQADGSDLVTLVGGPPAPGFRGFDVDVDRAAGKFYFSEVVPGTDDDFLKRADLDGSNEETLAISTSINGVAIDVTAGKLYYANVTTSNGDPTGVYEANLDGTNPRLVAAGTPTFVAVDSVAGQVYWTDRLSGQIRRANVDGTGVATVLDSLPEPQDIELDPEAGHMYWVDSTSDQVLRANLDGTNVVEVIGPGRFAATGASPIGVGLDLDEGKLYWSTTSGSSELERSNLDGTNIETIRAFTRLAGIDVVRGL